MTFVPNALQIVLSAFLCFALGYLVGSWRTHQRHLAVNRRRSWQDD